MTIVAFHGTSSRRLERIAVRGLDDPYVTDSPARAAYYAREEAEQGGGEPMVLELRVDPRRLRYDAAAMSEPVMAGVAERDRAWQAAEREHPGWVHGRALAIPSEAWQVSWAGVGSARVAGRVPPSGCLRRMNASVAAALLFRSPTR